MATIDVTVSSNLTAVTYAQDDIINVLDGVTLTVNSQWSIKPRLIQALGTGRIEFSNTSTTVPHLQEFYMQNGANGGGFLVQQNAALQVLGDWITVGTSTGANNQVLFSANNIGGKSIDYPTNIQVETGNGTNTWEIWNAIPEDVAGGVVNTLGFNAANITDGTVAVASNGVVTGISTNFTTLHPGLPFKLPSIARDFVVASQTSATSITLQELNGSTYTGGVVAAGSSYILRSGSLIAPSQVGSGDIGKVLFFNPVSTAVRMGDDTNGTKIPTGARVRVPNIHFNSAIQQTTLAAAITSTAAQTITLAATIGTTAIGAGYASTSLLGTLLLVNGSTIERIFYSTRSGTTVSATSMVRGAAGTTAQASFPIGTLVYWMPTNNSTTNNSAFNTNPSGTIDMQVCSTGMRMQNNFNNFLSCTLKNFGGSVIALGNCAGFYDVDNISNLGYGYQIPNAINNAMSFSALLGSGNIKNLFSTNSSPAQQSTTNISLNNVQNAQFVNNLRSRQWGRCTLASTLNYVGVGITTVKCATPVDGIYSSGAGIRTTVLTNIDVKNIFLSSLSNGNTVGSNDTMLPLTLVSTTNSTFRGLQIWDGGIATRASLISIDSGCSDIVCHNKGYPTIAGGSQLSSIVSDIGLNSIVAWISVASPRISTNLSVLSANITGNLGKMHRMLLIDSITSTASGSGAFSKGGVELDIVAGPHRQFNTTTTQSIIPNLADVQPIVVMSNLAKTVGSVYVGGFSSQSVFNMYTFTGGTYLDNLGRIYYPSIGDLVIIKSIFPLRGIANFTGTAFDFNYNLSPGSNTVPAGTTFEFRMVNWGTANTGAWTAFVNNASLETARAALAGYSSSVGIDLQFRITGTTAIAGRYLMGIKLPVTIDASYNPPVYETQVGISGAQTSTLLAGYLNADPNNPVLQGSLIMGGSFGSIAMPYDYDGIPVDYRLIARLQGWTFIDITGIYDKSSISVPITQTQIVDVNGNPLYTSGVTGVTVDHIAEIITVSANLSAVEIWSAVQDNICLLENLTKADPFVTTNGLVFYSSYTLVVTGSITSGNISSNVILSGSLSGGVTITGNVSQATPTTLIGVVINGDLTYNTNTPITITFLVCTITGTVSNSGTALVTITLTGASVGTTGTNVLTQRFAIISAPNLLNGSRVRVYDEDNDVELYNDVLVSAGFNQSFVYTADTTVTLTATYTSGATAKLGVSTTGVFTATGVSFLNSQEDDTVYNGYAIDGSLVTGFSADYVQDDVNLTMATNFMAANLYAWWIYTLTTEDGIRNFFGGITALDAANIENDASIVDLFLDNSTADFIYQTDSIRFFKSNGVYPARIVTTGGGGIQVNWNSNVYVGTANVPSSAQNATATIAAMNAAPPDVNVAKMNGATVLGTGVSNDLWRG